MLYSEWCNRQVDASGGKELWRLSELEIGRETITDELTNCIRSHYDSLVRIAEDVRELGFPHAAALLSERMPRSARARSGDLGEILATELVEEHTDFTVPIRRLRYKDGREMALRGDDFIGIKVDATGNLHFLKGESKSRAILAAGTITEARAALSRDNGRPTATSVLFVADRLLDAGGALENLGRKIRNEVVTRSVPAANNSHMLFTMSGNTTPRALVNDLAAASTDRGQYSVHLRIEDHQNFIKTCYERALALGDD